MKIIFCVIDKGIIIKKCAARVSFIWNFIWIHLSRAQLAYSLLITSTKNAAAIRSAPLQATVCHSIQIGRNYPFMSLFVILTTLMSVNVWRRQSQLEQCGRAPAIIHLHLTGQRIRIQFKHFSHYYVNLVYYYEYLPALLNSLPI